MNHALAIAAAIGLALGSVRGHASTDPELTGRIIHLTHDAVRIGLDGETLTVDRRELNPAEFPAKLRLGDTVRIRYRLQIREISVLRSEHGNGEAGQVPPAEVPSMTARSILLR